MNDEQRRLSRFRFEIAKVLTGAYVQKGVMMHKDPKTWALNIAAVSTEIVARLEDADHGIEVSYPKEESWEEVE